MKKFINIFIIIVLLSSNFATPEIVRAKTLADLESELNEKQNEYNQNEIKKKLTEEEIARTNSEIISIKESINQTYIDIENIQKEIDNLYEKIASKKAEVKQILNFLQVSNGESAYLEYIFGAESFTDLIYRAAVAEQMTRYNDKLVKEYNGMIEDSQKKQKELQAKQIELGNYQSSLESKVASLGQTLEEEKSTGLSIQDEIDYQKEIIEMYRRKGCGINDDIATCGRSVLPSGTAFYRPTATGRVTSEFGKRNLLSGWHEGIDIGVGEGTTVYSIGMGMVASVIRYSSCGGNMVVVHHNINNKTYTSVYAHLLSINVSEGETVNRNSIIGYSGGSSTSSYDKCTFGAHLHLTVATGLYGVDYTSWTIDLNKVHALDPRSVINFPAGLYNSWTDRITAY